MKQYSNRKEQEAVIAILRELETALETQAQAAGDMKREYMDEDWGDQELIDQLHGRREAYIQASETAHKTRLRIGNLFDDPAYCEACDGPYPGGEGYYFHLHGFCSRGCAEHWAAEQGEPFGLEGAAK